MAVYAVNGFTGKKKGKIMRKLMGLLGLMAIITVATGCAHTAGFSAGKINAGYHARVHAWEEPHFTADLESNPVKSELGMGFVTVGSQAGFAEQPDGKWLTLDASVGPK